MKFRKKSRIFKPKHNAQLLKLLARSPAKQRKPVDTSKDRATLPQKEAGKQNSMSISQYSMQESPKSKKSQQ